MRLKTLLRVLCTLLFTSIAMFAQEVYQKTDSFSGATRYFTKRQEVKLEGGSFFSMRYVYFTLAAHKPSPSVGPPYRLEFDLNTQGWVFVESGPSLILKIDGRMLSLSGEGSIHNRELGIVSGSVVERAMYPITYSQLKELAEATKVEFRLIGSKQIITGEWKPTGVALAAVFFKRVPSLINDPDLPKIPVVVPQDPTPAQEPLK